MNELLVRSAAQQIYTTALSSAWRPGTQLYDPSTWLQRYPDMEEQMLRDADIAHAVGFRQHLVAGRQWALQPRRETERAGLAVEVGTELLEGIKNFTGSRLKLARAFFSGARFARIICTPRRLAIGDGRPRTWMVPTHLVDIDKRSFRRVPVQGEDEMIRAHWEKWVIGPNEWREITPIEAADYIKHVYQDEQATLGYGRGLREAAAWWWYAKQHVFAESLTTVEKHGGGTLHAKINGARDAKTGLPNEALINQWVAKLESLRSKHVIVSDSSDEIEIMPAPSDNGQLQATMRSELRSTIFTLFLGANLTTSADKGGSYALAEIQENSTEALIQFDRELLEETLTDDLLGCVWFKNHPNLVELGIAQDKPRFSIQQEKRTDPMDRIQVIEGASRIGLPMAVDDVYEQLGCRKPEDGEELLKVPQPAVPPGGGFGGAGDPLGAALNGIGR